MLVDVLAYAPQFQFRSKGEETKVDGFPLIKNPHTVMRARHFAELNIPFPIPCFFPYGRRQTGNSAGHAVNAHIAQFVHDTKAFVVLVNALHHDLQFILFR
ncbi:hypothetical protein D3C77_685140 [compost metagenome]